MLTTLKHGRRDMNHFRVGKPVPSAYSSAPQDRRSLWEVFRRRIAALASSPGSQAVIRARRESKAEPRVLTKEKRRERNQRKRERANARP